ASHAGTCPTRLTFDGQIRSDQPGNVRYVWVRSDGVISPEATVTFAGPGVQPVRTTWELGTPGFSGQVSMVLRVLTRGRAISSTPAAAVLRCAAPPPVALPPKVSPEVRVALFVSPVRHKGPCPVTIKFEAVIKSNVAGPVRYVWERSDGARSPERTVTFAAPGEQVVAEKWSLGAANVKTKAGQVLRILSPVANVSATFAAIVECDGPAVTPPPVTPPRVTPPPVTPPPVLPKAAVTVSASVEPARHDGACPVTVRFTGVIGSNRAGPVRYRWISGGFRDNRTETGPDQTITFDAPGSRTVTDTWAHERRFKGWRKLELLAPATATSAEAAFEVICSGDDAKKKRKPKE
ncbi:MAG TPA: hypothetical protein PK264_11370, partial [Hyphomicrobiaceae bacterium]|nr:hypothetical protein [Hyphomicrobiaceae bacterium]